MQTRIGIRFVLVVAAVATIGCDRVTKQVATELAIIQLEKDWVQAALKKDAGAMDRIIAEDWIGIAFNGTSLTKAEVLNDLRSGATASQTIELGPLKVRVYGDTAIVNGSSTEKSTWQGKDSSGHYVLVDVFINRNGRWQVVSSQVTKTN